MSGGSPILSGIVVHWRDPEHLVELVAAWPTDDPRFELVVVDNGGGDGVALPPPVRRLAPGSNLGFAGGANAGAAAARGTALLFLNPDARPLPGALAALAAGLGEHPAAAGLAPRLIAPDGSPQWRWQLRELPRVGDLVAQALFLDRVRRPAAEPAAGAAIAQPAAAALLLRRAAFEQIGGFDAGFHPAWFEDVDLARRLATAGLVLRYHPAAVFTHALGSTVPELGYGEFLVTYDRNLARYLRKHHGRGAALAFRAAVPIGALARLVALPLARPKRAASRTAAATALLRLAAKALAGFPSPLHDGARP